MKDICLGGTQTDFILEQLRVESIMAAHLSGEANYENKLWALINLVCWHREFHRYRGSELDLSLYETCYEFHFRIGSAAVLIF